MAETTWRNWANLAAYGVNFAFTFASSLGWLGPDNTVLSAKYTTLVTPAGAAFSIWGFIFLGELIFAVGQMLPSYRGAKFVELATPGWLAACFFQSLWSVAFAQELIAIALVGMLGILAGLLWVAASTDGLALTWGEYGVLRLPLSLHLGWIIAASTVNANVLLDFWRSSPETLLGFAVTSVGAVCILATIFATSKVSADPVVCLVAAWAFYWISVELSNPVNLDSPDRHNPYVWDRVTLAGLQAAASNVSRLAVALAGVAAARVAWSMWRRGGAEEKSEVSTQELVPTSGQGA